MMYELELNRKPTHQDPLILLDVASMYAKIVNYAKIRSRWSFFQIESRSWVATPRTTFPVDNNTLGGIRKHIFSRFASRRHHTLGTAQCEWSSLCNNAIKPDDVL